MYIFNIVYKFFTMVFGKDHNGTTGTTGNTREACHDAKSCQGPDRDADSRVYKVHHRHEVMQMW